MIIYSQNHNKGYVVFLVFMGVVALGYLYQIIENTLKGENHLPDFKDRNKLLVNGLKFLGVILSVSILFIVIGVILGQVNISNVSSILYL